MSENTDPLENKKISYVREHITEVTEGINKGKHKCKYCESYYTVQGVTGSTSSVATHLKKHGIVRSREGSSSSKIKAPTVVTYTVENLRRCLLKLTVMRNLPFSFVEYPEFRELCTLLRIDCDHVSTDTLVRDIESAYRQEKQSLAEFLHETTSKISLTTDCWTSRNHLPFMVHIFLLYFLTLSFFWLIGNYIPFYR